MKKTKSITSCLLSALAMTALSAGAANVTMSQAKAVANNFLKQQVAAGTLKAPATADLKLAHAEASSRVAGANDYYIYNIKGGGFIIVAGEDRATQVLGYSDKGQIDANHMPAPLKDVLNGYKQEIEFLQTYSGTDLKAADKPGIGETTTIVAPLIQTTWGQEMPYYLQCPVYQGEYCVVGCVATAMAQVMYYWQYPTSCSSVSSFYCSSIRQTVPALPATTFDYSKMIPSYCHWDYDNSQLVQDTYTDEQAQEVAKLSRYCGQAVKMGYSPDGSGAYVYNQLSAMKNFGYSSSAQDVSKGSAWGWGSDNYTTTQWESMMKTELDAGRPILYSATDPSAGGHAFICDGYNSNGYFHFNYGWYGTCDGWYVSTSLSMVHRDGDQLNFSTGHEMLTGMEPPTYCIINAAGVDASNNLLILGQSLDTEAQNVTLRTSYSNINLAFALTDATGNRLATGDAISLSRSTFEQGSTVNGTLTLPTTLTPGIYNLQLGYSTTGSDAFTTVGQATGQLVVVARVAKFNSRFDVSDVTAMISYVLNNSGGPALDVSDVTQVISYILGN